MVDLVRTGLGIGKTIKNAGRLREIISVLARNGFDEVLTKTNLIKLLPNFVLPKGTIPDVPKEKRNQSTGALFGYRLRRAFEELGPGFIKIGQLLSTRDDIFGDDFVEEMKMLRDQVKGIPFSEAQQAIQSQLGKPINEIFSSIDSSPIGTASIGVVYKGTLISGEQVVIKLRRPGIIKSIETDFELLEIIVQQIERVSEEIKYLGISRAVRDFAVTLRSELDFRVEARNCDKLKDNISRKDPDNIFYLPKIYHQFTTEEILVMECLQGTPFTRVDKINPLKEIIRRQLDKGVEVFVHSILADGFFHADLHGGNFFLLEDNRIGIIDFGLIGTLSKRGRSNLVALLYSIVTHNYENLVYEFLDVAEFDEIPDVDLLIRDVRDSLSPFIGLTVQQINTSLLFRTIIQTLSRHQLFLPREWYIVFRALITLDGVGKSLEMDFDIFGILERNIKQIISELVSKDQVMEELVWIGRDAVSSLRSFPRHIKWYLREFTRNNFKFKLQISELESSADKIFLGIQNLGMFFLAGFFIISGTLLIQTKSGLFWYSYPVISIVHWGIGLALALVAFFRKK